MALKRIVVLGAGGHARVVLDAIEKQGLYRVLGLLDRPGGPSTVAGYPVLGSEVLLPELVGQVTGGVVAVGDNQTRWRVVQGVRQIMPEFAFVSVVHPSAVLGARVEISPGAVVLAGSVVNPDCQLGAHSLVNTGASLDHESVLGDFASLAPGVVTGGNVVIGERTAIGLAASVINGVRIGPDSVVGAGAVVLEDVPERVVAYGVPARVVRQR